MLDGKPVPTKQCPERGPALDHARTINAIRRKCEHCGANPDLSWPSLLDIPTPGDPFDHYTSRWKYLSDEADKAKAGQPIHVRRYREAARLIETALTSEIIL